MENINNDPSTLADATSTLNVGADQTPFRGTVQGASFQSAGGFRDAVTGDDPSGGYSLDGVDDIITDVKSAPTQTTIICHIDPSSVNDFSRIYSSEPSGTLAGFRIVMKDKTNTYLVALKDASGNEVSVSSALDLANTSQVGLTYDGSTLRQIKNGSFTGSSQLSIDPKKQRAAIGGRINGTQAESFPGVVDDLRIFNRAITASEVAQNNKNISS
jgi:hypothetical protein